jgi:maltose alpha-D-glucosyltransferase/alpha-amylase
MPKAGRHLVAEPGWYRDAVIYEVHVKSFCDANGDGMGDFRGLTTKLDYLQSLGVTAIWLLPFYPSPWRDDGYDISDYYEIHPQFGTVRDFRAFLQEAHRRGLKVITELVLNHTSDQHEWFERSRRATKGSPWRDYYVWSDTPERYADARIIFTDFESSNWSWDPVAKAYYWHRFYSHQPDLNFDNPAVVRAMLKVLDYWFEMGVDGMRLDAVPYLFEREGTNCENLPETYAYLEKVRAHLDRKFENKMLLAEANQWPEDAVAYFGDGNRCHMAFHFPLMPRLFMGAWMEDRFPIVDIFEQTPEIPQNCQWALFLRNHDELTLEMVSDEERDYMYRVYARDPSARINLGIRRRLAPLLGNNRRKIELMNFLLLSLPGTPVLYYGDEIGMGDNHYLGDRNGVRTPMQWSADRNAGFSHANPQQLLLPVIIDPDYHYEALNVESQERNLSSLLWWTRRVIATRKRFRAFGRGTIEFLQPDNPKVLAFVREFEDEHILVVANLSRFSQAVELDLSAYVGYVPEEVVSGNRFPVIKDDPYVLTLGFHDYYWLLLTKEEEPAPVTGRDKIPEFTVAGSWEGILQGKPRERLERDILPRYIRECRWFGGKSRSIQQLKIRAAIPITRGEMPGHLLMLDVRYTEGASESYLLPSAYLSGEHAGKLLDIPQAVIARLHLPDEQGILHDAVHNPAFRSQLLQMISRKQKLRVAGGEVVATAGKLLKKRTGPIPIDDSQVLRAEQSNTSILYGDEYFLKIYRRLDEGISPELELGQFLAERTGFTNTPGFAGAIEYRRPGSEPIVLGLLQEFVRNQGDAWSYSLDAARSYIERVLAKRQQVDNPPYSRASIIENARQTVDPLMQELVGGVYLERARLLGIRTGELHTALASGKDDPRFKPESFTQLYQRSLYHAMRTLTRRTLDAVRKQRKNLDPQVRDKADMLLSLEKEMIARMSLLFERKISALKTRIHGDYHLGQVLFTGSDFFVIDFEGEPVRTIGERQLKRSPLRDVAGMIRSFHYPVYAHLFTTNDLSDKDIQELQPWADLWHQSVSAVFLRAYLETCDNATFLPKAESELKILLDAFLLEKAIYEVDYELNNRPAWVAIPLQGILTLMEKPE